MSTPNDPTRVALDGLRRATTPGPDDLDHLPPSVLDGLGLGTLGEVDRETAEEHLAGCAQCVEDVADRRTVQAAIDAEVSNAPVGARSRGPRLMVLGFAAAAVVVLAVTVARRTGQPDALRDGAPTVAAPMAVRSGEGERGPQAPGRLEDGARPSAESALVTRVLASGRLELPPDASALVGVVGTLLGAESGTVAFGPSAPLGTAVSDVRPRFSWRTVQGATAYTVRVFDDRFRAVTEARVAATFWVPPTDLARDATYSWQVTAHRAEGDLTAPAPPQPEARFRVVTATVAEETARQRARLASDPLTLGIQLARAGLVTEADAALAAAAAVPDQRAMALSLRRSLPGGATGYGSPTTTKPAQ